MQEYKGYNVFRFLVWKDPCDSYKKESEEGKIHVETN
jgi:hypothetical protein